MEPRAFILLALKTLQCTQKELATKLNVSPTQISKWKKGEHMSSEMINKLKNLTDIGELDPDVVTWAGSVESAIKWEKLIHFLANNAIQNSETGYNCALLSDEEGELCSDIIRSLSAMGVTPPLSFPPEIDIDYLISTNDDFEEQEEQYDLLQENEYCTTISSILNTLTSVDGFYSAFIYDIFWDDELDLFNTEAFEFESNLVSLAACKIDVNKEFAPEYNEFKYRTLDKNRQWLSYIKEKAIRAKIPLKAELLDLVNKTKDELDIEVERESLGFNQSRIHPDIYVNELLQSVRIIHQVLPAILKKLEIYDEFKLDESDLHL